MDVPEPGISLGEYQQRREAVLQALEGAAAVVFAGNEPAPESVLERWKTDRLFWYLTGLDHESGGVLLFDPTAENPDRRITLLLPARNPETERWYGPRDSLDSAFKAKTGFSGLGRTLELPSRLTEAARRAKRVACLHPFTPYTSGLSPDLEIFRKVSEHVPGVSIEDRTQLLPRMRAVKSAAEVSLMEQAVAATAAGYKEAFRVIRPGVSEREIADTLTAAFRSRGGVPAFPAIVGSGGGAAVLHYRDLDQIVEEGDLVLIDYAAAFGGYASDVTRTVPASGLFSAEQRELYNIVLEANLAAVEAARPGTTAAEVHKAAVRVMAKAGHEDHFIHGIGHQLGIDVHDVTPDGPLVPGMVLTIEPGIYLPDRRIGIRIEDDILLTDSGNRNLTESIPKTVKGIEAAMAPR